jgi:uncharacterized protein YijF (DUF1287 family)
VALLVNRTLLLRGLLRLMLALAVGVAVAAYGPVRRFYVLHAPVWAARGAAPARSDFAARIVAGARAQIGTLYDAGYRQISYPGGDVSAERGACSDVVVRALRHAGVDLQQSIHEDMLRAPAAYPEIAGAGGPDANIDHRRCLNQMRFFERNGQKLTTELSAATREEWQPGDLIYWRLSDGRQHTGVVSDRTNGKGWPLVIHNANVCLEQDCLRDWAIVGHYRCAAVERMIAEEAIR